MVLKAADPKIKDRRAFKSIKVGGDKTPKSFDTEAQFDLFKGKTNVGIYKVDGDKVTLCLPNKPSKDRPKEFAALKESGLLLMELKRLKDK